MTTSHQSRRRLSPKVIGTVVIAVLALVFVFQNGQRTGAVPVLDDDGARLGVAPDHLRRGPGRRIGVPLAAPPAVTAAG